MTKPIVHMYGILWNEELMLPYFFRHYDSLVDKYILYDHDSTDRTKEILEGHPNVTIRRYVPTDVSVCQDAVNLKNECWKESRGKADLVLICDVDEFLYRGNLVDSVTTEHAKGTTIYRPIGWDMISEDFPTTSGQIYEEVTHGRRSVPYDKWVLFDPNRIDEINYLPGCHVASPRGYVEGNKTPMYLLHMRYLSVDYVHQRYIDLWAKLTPEDHRMCYGNQYRTNRARIAKDFQSVVPEKVV